MPRLTQWFIKAALVYLIVAIAIGLILALPSQVKLPASLRLLGPTYYHAFLVGWVTQMIFGVIFWMFPIITRTRPRGNEQIGWNVFILLNVGLILRIVIEPLISTMSTELGWLLVVSAVLQWTAALLFVFLAWPRVKDRYRGE